MAGDQRSSSGRGGSRKTSKRSKRKPVTIDLTATDVTAETADIKDAGKAETETQQPKPETAANADGPASAEETKIDTVAGSSADKDSKTSEPEKSVPKAATSTADEPKKAEPAKATKSVTYDKKSDETKATQTAAPKPSEKPAKPETPRSKSTPATVAKTQGDPSAKSSVPTSGAATTDNAPSNVKGTGSEKAAAAEQTKGGADEKPMKQKDSVSKAGSGGATPPPPSSVAPPPAPQKGGGFLSLLAASIVGGLIGVGVLYGLLVGGYLPVAQMSDLDAVSRTQDETLGDVAILETRLDEIQAQAVETATALADASGQGDRVAVLEGEVEEAVRAISILADGAGTAETALQEFQAVLAERSNAETDLQDRMGSIGDRLSTFGDRMTALEEASGARQRAMSEIGRDLAESGDRLARVEALQSDLLDLRKLVETGAAGSDIALASLEESIGGLRDRVNALAAASSTAVIDARLSALEASTGGVDVVARRLGTLEAEVDAMANRVSEALRSFAPDSPQIDEAVSQAFANLEPRLSALSSDLAGASSAFGELQLKTETLAAALESETAALRQSVDALSAATNDQNGVLSGALDALSGRITALEEEISTPGALDQAALAIAVTRLKDAVASGAPFATEFAAVKGMQSVLGDRQFDLGALEARADTGIKRTDAIIAAWPATARAIEAALTPETEADNPVDKVLTDLQSLIKVTPVGAGGVDGGGVSAINTALNSGDLASAERAWQELPDAAKAVSADWAGDLSARLAADAIVERVSASVIESLASSTN